MRPIVKCNKMEWKGKKTFRQGEDAVRRVEGACHPSERYTHCHWSLRKSAGVYKQCKQWIVKLLEYLIITKLILGLGLMKTLLWEKGLYFFPTISKSKTEIWPITLLCLFLFSLQPWCVRINFVYAKFVLEIKALIWLKK